MVNEKYMRYRGLLAILIAVSLLWSGSGAVLAAPAPQTYTFEECDRVEEATLRDELNRIAQQALGDESIDIEQIVDTQWRLLGLDAIVDAEVERAVEQVRSEEDYLSRLWSGWSAEKAQELAAKVAEYAFGSPEFKAAITSLSDAVAADITAELEVASARSASSTLVCLQEFIGERYSENLITIFQSEIERHVEGVEFDELDTSVSLLETHSTAIAGIGVIIGTQIAKRLAQKLAQRLAGKVVGRIVGRAAASVVPIAGWIVGAGLIVWDLVEGGNGALPQIEDALKADDVKQEIRAETVAAIAPELATELPQVARTIANDIYSSWTNFKAQYEDVLALAEENAAFRALLDNASTEEIFRMARFVSVGLNALGFDALVAAIDDGTFERAFHLPDSALSIIETSKSFESAIAWSELSGSMLDDVVRLEIYKVREPDMLDRNLLTDLVGFDDAAAVTTLLLLDDPAVETMLSLPTDVLETLVASYNVDDLSWLADYLAALETTSARNQLVTRLVDSPAIIEQLKNEKVKEVIVTSDDVNETIDFLASPRTLQTFFLDTYTLANGNVSWWQHYQKYAAIWIGLFVILGLLVLRFIFWYLRPFISPKA